MQQGRRPLPLPDGEYLLQSQAEWSLVGCGSLQDAVGRISKIHSIPHKQEDWGHVSMSIPYNSYQSEFRKHDSHSYAYDAVGSIPKANITSSSSSGRRIPWHYQDQHTYRQVE